MKVNKNIRREIEVYANWDEQKPPVLMGRLYAEPVRGNEIFSFEYDKSYLKDGMASVLDPDLRLYGGTQYLAQGKENFGLFLDSSPDRWGRLLMRRREAALARYESRPERTLLESDYLLGVFDEQRMGALRFKTDATGPFLNDDVRLSSPPWISLRTLEEISLKLENEDAVDDPEYLKWLNMLIQPGSSLGGARPKAGVHDPEGHLWIAKFPSLSDGINIGAWEMVVHQLAVASGVNMAQAQIHKFSSPYDTFLTKRFDRKQSGGRIHFASAMTLLGYSDGTDFHDGVSYLELAEFIIQNCCEVNADLEEMWRRIVFHIAVSNTDDHLRNHGFLLTKTGWRLSPAFDINPNPDGRGLKLNISENDNSLDLELVMSVKDYFRVSDKKADQIVGKISESVSQWKSVSSRLGISRNEQELMERAFGRV
ncbi:serine/threonine-protein kinase HipA [Breznakibacter xylanolyticus]|uniref:Serine/threonine-protein kinase HipA n=1 Tax=Breznakibacter xylanolyticus TaxID=990 RepID=A0A2W7N659_9BACT|nr:serine/threonine-protein kinase HipA [Breznakibacter xylanolyticus]